MKPAKEKRGCGMKLTLAERDELIGEAYAASMSDWHSATVAVIHNGITSDEFRSDINASDIARRLIGWCVRSGWPNSVYRVRFFRSGNLAPSGRDDGKRVTEKPLIDFHLGRYLTRRVFLIGQAIMII